MTVRWNGFDADINPALKRAIDDALGPLPAVYLITSGFRTPAEQAAEFAKGRDENGVVIDRNQIVTNANFDQSPHTRAGAIDFVPLTSSGAANWSAGSAELKAAVAAVRAQPALRSGADFVLANNSADPWHAELTYWRTLGVPTFAADATAVAAAAASGNSGGGGEVSAFDDSGIDDSTVPPPSDSWLQLDDGFVIEVVAAASLALLVVGLYQASKHDHRRRVVT